MQLKKNVGKSDKKIRILLAEVLGLLAYFWFGGVVAIVLWILAGVMLVTAVTGFCGLYVPLGVSTYKEGESCPPVAWRVGFVSFVVLILLAGSYASMFFTRKIYLEDFNRMNGFYKQTLFLTGQGKRPEAIENYQKLIFAFADFKRKYSTYRPYVLRGDAQFGLDFDKAGAIVASVNDKIMTGDLSSAHTDLEAVRPIFQEIFKRNGFSMLAVSLVDFHDAMEKILTPATAKNAEGVLLVYPEVSDKLKAVEESANDADIRAIRDQLEGLRALAAEGKADALPEKGASLKSSFVKVYLVRG